MLSIDLEVLARGHEQVAFHQDTRTKTVSIAALHSTVLGPAFGGCRMHRYASLEEALIDELRLSEGMTYKNSLAGLHLGGGHGVMIADPTHAEGHETLFVDFGRFVDSFGGTFYTVEDTETSVTAPYTARGVFQGMRACLERVFGSDNFQARRVVVQGVRHVGRLLVELLVDAGATVTISDTRPDVLDDVCRTFRVSSVAAEKILTVECDVLSPCATSGIINWQTVGELRTKILAGAANNQLLGTGVEEELAHRSILYAPDYAINAGGVILCADELEPGGFTESRVIERVDRIYRTVGRILDEAKESGELPGAVALRLARERIEHVRKKIG